MIVAINATAYDPLPSGARVRAVGIAAALLRRGVEVHVFVPPGGSLAALVEAEHGGPLTRGRYRETEAPLDPRAPLRRALASRRWFERNVPRGAAVFLTDYYPVLSGVRTAVTVHDLRYFALPECEPRLRAAWFRAAYPAMAQEAALVVVPTRAVAREAAEYLGVEGGRVVVVPNGLSRAWREAAPAGSEAAAGAPRHLLAVGAAERRKGLATAIEALRRVARDRPVPPLVVVGRLRGPRPRPRARRFEYEGVVDDTRLVALCRGAAALVHPSRYEGFGLPVIEALSIGVPVLAARCSAVEEVAGGFARLLPPGDAGAWAAAIAALLDPATAPPRPDLAAARYASRFTWDSAAAALAACL